MEEIRKLHVEVMKLQATVLKKEMKRCSQELQNVAICVEVPQTLKHSNIGLESARNSRVTDNFEVTIMYLLDKDGKIQERNRLEMFMILMNNIADKFFDRRVLCMHLLDQCLSDAMKACFMDSGGLHLIEQWIIDVELSNNTAQNLDYLLLMVHFLHCLPAIAVSERNISQQFFNNALMPLAKLVKLKAFKNNEKFKNAYTKLKEEYARVNERIRQIEKVRQLEKRKMEEVRNISDDDTGTFQQPTKNAQADVNRRHSNVTGGVHNAEDGVVDDIVDIQMEDDFEFVRAAPSYKSKSAISRTRLPSLPAVEKPISRFSYPTSQDTPESHLSNESSLSGLDALNENFIDRANVAASSSARSPRPINKSRLPPPLSLSQPYDHRTEKKTLKSILKKGQREDLDTLPLSSTFSPRNRKRISFRSSDQLDNTCAWYGGKESYYQWARPSQLDLSVSISANAVDSIECIDQENRLRSVPEVLKSQVHNDPLGLEIAFAQRPRDISVSVIPWVGEGDEESVIIDDIIKGPPPFAEHETQTDPSSLLSRVLHFDSDLTCSNYDIETIPPCLNDLVKKGKRSIHVAIWNYASQVIGFVEGHTAPLAAIGSEISKVLGKAYLSKCPGQNLRKVLLRHPEQKFTIIILQGEAHVRVKLVLSDVWNGVQAFLEEKYPSVVLMSVLHRAMEDFFGHCFLERISKASLLEVLTSHPLSIFKVYDVEKDNSIMSAVSLRASSVEESVTRIDNECTSAIPVSLENAEAHPTAYDEKLNRNMRDNDDEAVVEEKFDDATSVNLQHISNSFANGVDPYLNLWSQDCSDDDDDDDDDVDNDYEDKRNTIYSTDDSLRETLLCTFVEHIKARGIVGLRKSQINANLSRLYYNCCNSRHSSNAYEQGVEYLMKDVTTKKRHVFLQKQFPSRNHLLYYIDNPCVTNKNWEKEVSCAHWQLKGKNKCQNAACKYQHRKMYDDHERGFSDSTTKRGISEDMLKSQILGIINDAKGVIFNFEIFERYYKKFGCRLCFGDRVTICTEALALHQLLIEYAEIHVYSDPRCTDFKVMGYSISGSFRSVEDVSSMMKPDSLVDMDGECQDMAKEKDKLYQLIKERGSLGIVLDQVPQLYFDKYGEECRFTLGGELDLDLESVIEGLPGIKRDCPGENDVVGSSWGNHNFCTVSSWDENDAKHDSVNVKVFGHEDTRPKIIFYYDKSKSFIDADGCLDIANAGKLSRGGNYHVKKKKREEGRAAKDKMHDIEHTQKKRRCDRNYNSDNNHRRISRHFGEGQRPLLDEGDSYSHSRGASVMSDYNSGRGIEKEVYRDPSRSASRPPRRKRVCRYFNTSKGCSRGNECSFLHQKAIADIS